ncbi:MAG: iron chelate uptake ABC transporter family permease subunit [Azospirillaceae bacterium]|nr:iron chelate uptake ABC transporter family permease subunit [Azospirillaceae bacterium]
MAGDIESGPRLRAFARVSVLTGVAIAFVGIIGFVELIAPQVAPMRAGEPRLGYSPQDISGRIASAALEVVLLGRLRRLGLFVTAADLAAVEVILAESDDPALG